MAHLSARELQGLWQQIKFSSEDNATGEDSTAKLRTLFAQVIAAGRYVSDLADREDLQWTAREIGDWLFRASDEYHNPFILPLEGQPQRYEPRVSIARLPVSGVAFVDREEELNHLDTAWNDPGVNVAVLVAVGGMGKSALVNHWLDRLGAEGWRDAERILGWSFYSQGMDTAGASGDAFVDYALGWLGNESTPSPSPWEKGARLAELVRERRTLLILDGLEPLQHPPGVQTGRLKDPAIAALVRDLAASNSGLCLITSRLSVSDILGRAGVVQITLEALPESAGAELLQRLGVIGTEVELRQTAKEFGGHALALTLLGSYLRDVCGGDVRRRHEVSLLDEEIEGEDHAHSVLTSYEMWLGPGSEIEVLYLLGLFDRAAEAAALTALRMPPSMGLSLPLLKEQ